MYKKVVCFDLDDTLYKEIDFLESAYKEIADSAGHPEMQPQMVKWYREGLNVFQELNQILNVDTPITDYLKKYRNHYPTISLSNGVEDTLNELKHKGVILGLITDGRSISQRNKLKALRIESLFDDILISEETGYSKPSERPYVFFMEKYPQCSYLYLGDNPAKDFIAANRLRWMTVCLIDNGKNIHKQDFELGNEYLPLLKINHISELAGIVCNEN